MKFKDWLFVIIFFLSLALLAWFDVTSSAQAGLKNADRSIAHVFIALSVILHAVYLFFHWVPTLPGNTINRTLTLIFLWFCCVDFIRGVSIIAAGPMLLLSIWWFLTYNFTYSYLKNNEGNLKPLLMIYISMFLVWIGLNLYARTQILIKYNHENAITGYAYYLLIFIPYILLLEKKKISAFLLLISVIMIITSFKRGTIVTLPVMLLAYGYIKGLQIGDVTNFINKFVIMSIFAVMILIIVNENSGGFLFERFSREELISGSGRTEYREIALNVVADRNLLDLFLGTGHNSSVKLIGTGIHNEWIEFLFSFGIIGLLLYLLVGIIFFKQGYYFYKSKSKYAPHMMMMIAYFYMVSLFSGFIGVYVTYYFFAFMGIITYLNEKEINMI